MQVYRTFTHESPRNPHLGSLFVVVLLLFFAFLIRASFLFPPVIPFTFDHGKDSIAVLHSILGLSPKLIGPWTSIPGLFFGPAWYYLLIPAYVLGAFSPVASVWLMIFLVLLQIYISYRFWGYWEALLVVCAPFWIIISTSAWNPFPMTLISFVILALLKQLKKTPPEKRSVLFFFLFLTASLGFHFSTAFAIFYPIILGVFFLCHWYPRPNRQQVLLSILGFVLPFVPQMIFELKYDFLQTRSVIAYFSHPEPHGLNGDKLKFVLETVTSTGKLAALPGIPDPYVPNTTVIPTIAVLIILWGFWRKKKHGATHQLFKETIVFIVVPTVGFLFLHFNVWYTLGLLPVFVIIVGHCLRAAPKWAQAVFLVMLLCTPFFSIARYVQYDKKKYELSRDPLPIKVRAINIIYERTQAGSIPFSSYHYVSEIYDYSYQYLYFWHAHQTGQPLPAEFSYKPGEISYIPEKNKLLSFFPQHHNRVEKVFFIVEKAEKSFLLERWWGDQHYGRIVDSVKLSDEVTLYEATPHE